MNLGPVAPIPKGWTPPPTHLRYGEALYLSPGMARRVNVLDVAKSAMLPPGFPIPLLFARRCLGLWLGKGERYF